MRHERLACETRHRHGASVALDVTGCVSHEVLGRARVEHKVSFLQARDNKRRMTGYAEARPRHCDLAFKVSPTLQSHSTVRVRYIGQCFDPQIQYMFIIVECDMHYGLEVKVSPRFDLVSF